MRTKKFFHSTFIEVVCYMLAIFAFICYLGELRAETRAEVDSGDTYNFYFQKAPGPTTVNQGTSGDSPAPATASKPTETNEAVVEKAEAVSVSESNEVAKEKFSRWSMSILYGRFKDQFRGEANPSLGLSFAFRFNNNIGLSIGLIKGRTRYLPWGATAEEAETTDYFFGVNFMPVKSNFSGGGSAEFGVGVGLMTSDYFDRRTYVTSYDPWPKRVPNIKTKIVAFAGPQINFLLNRSLGLTLESRFGNRKAQQYGAGLIFRF
jgi:hypothetical protein